MERICSPWGANFFLLEQTPFQKSTGVQEYKQEAIEVVSLMVESLLSLSSPFANKKSAESDVAPAGIKSYKFLFVLKKIYFAVFKKLMG